MKEKVSVAILCGGMSSRMGQEKGLVLFKNKPMIQHIIDAVESFSDDLFLMTSNADYKQFNLPMHSDVHPNCGPVGGIFSALSHAKNEKVLILSCDVPLISSRVLEKLIFTADQADVIYFKTNSYDHPLVGLYHRRIKNHFLEAIQNQKFKLMKVLENMNTNKIALQKEEAYQMQNINTQEVLNQLHMDAQKVLTLVGAGPGDPDLITVKGLKAIQEAKVILYDALVNEDLLLHAPNAKKIFVGKRLGCHAYTQDQINALIVAEVNLFGSAVRLKGGDSFVFGRGSEEIEYAQQFGIETIIIPGITSALAVPALQGISISKRGIAESFWVITGTTSQHELSNDVVLASKSSATVVILMGMHKLNQIVKLYQENRDDNLPVAIIQNGTTAEEKVLISTINEVEEASNKNQISSPAIIVIGEVVNHASKLKNVLKTNNYFSHTV
jgi:uroporphyrin-III C-methyltransferase